MMLSMAIPPNNTSELKKQVEQLQASLEELQQENANWQSKYETLLESFRLAKQRQYARSSEQNLLQGDLFDEADAPVPEPEERQEEETIAVAEHQRQKHPKRQPIPEHFPRERVLHDVPDSEKQCNCGCEKICIGEAISEQLDVIPPSFKVIQHVRPKYACRTCQIGVSIAPMPKLLLPKCMAAPGLVAYSITAKYTDHLPLYRQEQIWQRYGVELPRNTMCQWLMKTADQCEPLWELIAEHILSSDYVQADETPVQVLKEPDRTNQQKSYLWVYRGGPPKQIACYFTYEETRAAQLSILTPMEPLSDTLMRPANSRP